MAVKEEVTLPTQRICTRCKFVSSQEVCKACVLLEGLNKGLPKLGIGKSSKAKRMLDEYNTKQEQNLKDAIKQLDNDVEKIENNCQSNQKCRSNLCKNKRNGLLNKKSCNNKCSGNCDRTKVIVDNTKVDNLLAKYAIHEPVKKINTDDNNIVNVDEDFDTSDNEDVNIDQEDDTCSASCGKMGSLIGF